MERNRGKIVAAVALIVAVVALSVGFAAFSATLNITNASANMAATDEFTSAVNYTSTTSCYKTGSSTNVITTGYSSGTASGKNWDGIAVPLTKTDHSVTCASVEPDSTAAGYASNATAFCSASNGMQVTVTIGESSNTDTLTFTTSAGSISAQNNQIASNSTTKVFVVIDYTGSLVADGDVKVTIPTISFDYSTTR